MSDKVTADVDGLRQLRRDIDRAQQTIAGAMRHLRSSLAQTQWDDAARRAFEQQLNETVKSLQQFDRQAEALKPVLNRKIEALTAYLRH